MSCRDRHFCVQRGHCDSSSGEIGQMRAAAIVLAPGDNDSGVVVRSILQQTSTGFEWGSEEIFSGEEENLQ